MEVVVTLKKGSWSKIVEYVVPDEVVHVHAHVTQKFNRDGWMVDTVDEKDYYLATKANK